MNNSEAEQLDMQIDRYLADEMSSSERSQFETSMKSNPELAQKVSLRRKMTDFFRRDGQNLLSKLEQAGQKHLLDHPQPQSVRRSWALWAILLAALATSLVLYFNRPQPTQNNEVTPVISDTTKIEDERESIAMDTPAVIPTQAVPTEPPPARPPKPNPPPKQPEVTASPPIATIDPADYSPNPFLESLVADRVRSEVQIKISSPAAGDTLFLAKQRDIEFAGTINQSVTLRYLIFDNVEESFLNDEPLLRGELKLLPQGDKFSFQQIITRDLSGGRYYLLLQNLDTEEIISTMVFFVR